MDERYICPKNRLVTLKSCPFQIPRSLHHFHSLGVPTVHTAMEKFTNGFTPLYVFLNRIYLEEKTYSLKHGIHFTLRWNSKLYPVCG